MATPDQALRRFVVLSVLRGLPVGMFVIALVLLILARGHSLAAVGAIGAVHALVVAALELPTGSLADVLGRRPVLVAASVISSAGLVTFALARPLWQFALAAALVGSGRALASGPLEAWYVDTVREHDPGVDLRPALARGSAAGYAGLAVGALGGGLLGLSSAAGAVSSDVIIALSVPVLVGAGIWCAHGLLVLRFLTEDPRPKRRLADILRSARHTAREGVRLGHRHPVLPFVLVSGALLSPPAYAVESFLPTEIRGMLADASAGPLVVGILLTLSYVGGSLGAAAAVRAARLSGSSARGAVLLIALASAFVALLALPAGIVLLGTFFVLYQSALSAVDPLHATLVHDAVPAEVRATAVSAYSLTAQFGGAVGGFLLALLASSTSLTWGWLAAAAVMGCAAIPMMSRRLLPSRVAAAPTEFRAATSA